MDRNHERRWQCHSGTYLPTEQIWHCHTWSVGMTHHEKARLPFIEATEASTHRSLVLLS